MRRRVCAIGGVSHSIAWEGSADRSAVRLLSYVAQRRPTFTRLSHHRPMRARPHRHLFHTSTPTSVRDHRAGRSSGCSFIIARNATLATARLCCLLHATLTCIEQRSFQRRREVTTRCTATPLQQQPLTTVTIYFAGHTPASSNLPRPLPLHTT